MATLIQPTTEPLLSSPASAGGSVALSEIPYDLYVQLRDVFANRHVRMTYFDGALELVKSRQFLRERCACRLGNLVMAAAEVFGVPCTASGRTTLRRPGDGSRPAAGTEADTSFYFANEPAIRDNDEIDLLVDPPPDLAIEVDNETDSSDKLPVYAALGVPEVWRYDARARTLCLGRLRPDGSYAPIDRSESLPRLTRARVLEALALAQGLSDSEWLNRLREWLSTLDH